MVWVTLFRLPVCYWLRFRSWSKLLRLRCIPRNNYNALYTLALLSLQAARHQECIC